MKLAPLGLAGLCLLAVAALVLVPEVRGAATVEAPPDGLWRVGVGHRACVVGAASASLQGPSGPPVGLTADSDGCVAFKAAQDGAHVLTFSPGLEVVRFESWGSKPVPTNDLLERAIFLAAMVAAGGLGMWYLLSAAMTGFVGSYIPGFPFDFETLLFLAFLALLLEMAANGYKLYRKRKGA